MRDVTGKVLFCHGLESGPHGSKYQALTAAGLEVLEKLDGVSEVKVSCRKKDGKARG